MIEKYLLFNRRTNKYYWKQKKHCGFAELDTATNFDSYEEAVTNLKEIQHEFKIKPILQILKIYTWN